VRSLALFANQNPYPLNIAKGAAPKIQNQNKGKVKNKSKITTKNKSKSNHNR